ncbi:MAG: TIGR02206 family membrane protein [Bryobacterales bacterium]|nr:TIGR02206 family membrane protein [Bryobacterales bacterium]
MRKTDFQLFSLTHLAILAAVPLIASLLAAVARADRIRARRISLSLAVILSANEIIWYSYRYSTEGVRFPEGLPLQLCDAMVWISVAALLSTAQWVFESAFLIGIAGAGMALLTPDLWAPLRSYPSIYFFLAHGLIVAAVLYLVWSKERSLQPGCVWRVFRTVNLFALIVGTFNAIFHTNYMYLCRKPQGASLLDYLGPWPLYILAGEVLAFALLWTLWLPFAWARRGSLWRAGAQ